MPTHQSRAPRRAAQAVTDARASVEDDRSRRMRHYLVAMGVRTLSFPVAVWAFVQEYYVLAGVLAVLAAVLPSFAVMIANAADRRRAPASAAVPSPVRGLGPAGSAPAPEHAGPEVVPGTVIPGTVVIPGAVVRPGAPSPEEGPAPAPDADGPTRRAS